MSSEPVSVPLGLDRIHAPGLLEALLALPASKALLPLPVLLVALYGLMRLLEPWWRQLDQESTLERQRLLAQGQVDRRPLHCFLIVAVVLTLQEYFGSRSFYSDVLRPWLNQNPSFQLEKWDELYGYVWWTLARDVGYLVPFAVWPILYRQDHLLDLGLRTAGFKQHLWIYGSLLLVVGAAMGVVATQPEFLAYYPFYRQASRSYYEFLLWELLYISQFLTLELFFRGWMLAALRKSLGSAAIFAMMVPYCMIHFRKPYLEVLGAILAGTVLGTLAQKTRNIWGGFVLHVAVAVSMDVLGLALGPGLPRVWSPP